MELGLSRRLVGGVTRTRCCKWRKWRKGPKRKGIRNGKRLRSRSRSIPKPEHYWFPRMGGTDIPESQVLFFRKLHLAFQTPKGFQTWFGPGSIFGEVLFFRKLHLAFQTPKGFQTSVRSRVQGSSYSSSSEPCRDRFGFRTLRSLKFWSGSPSLSCLSV